MARMNRTQGAIVMVGLLAGLVIAGVPAFAQTSAPAPREAQGKGMMQPGMMNQEMMQKMSRMMDNCNRMMESMQNKGGTTPPSAPMSKGG